MSLYRDLVLSKGPHAFWPFDEDSPANSSQVADISGNGRHGTFVGNTWAVTTPPKGLGPRALNTGTSGYAQLTDAGLTAGPQTLEIWVYLPTEVSSSSSGLHVIGTATDNHYGLALGSSTSNLSGEVVNLGTGRGDRVGWAGFVIAAGWRHFVLSRVGPSGLNWHLYLDGVDVVTGLGAVRISSQSGATFTNQQWTVARYAGNQFDLDGVSSFAIYGTALSREDAALHYTVGAGDLYQTSLSPVVY